MAIRVFHPTKSAAEGISRGKPHEQQVEQQDQVKEGQRAANRGKEDEEKGARQSVFHLHIDGPAANTDSEKVAKPNLPPER